MWSRVIRIGLRPAVRGEGGVTLGVGHGLTLSVSVHAADLESKRIFHKN